MSRSLSFRRRRSAATFAALVPALIGGLVLIAAPSPPSAEAQRDPIDTITSTVSKIGGKLFTATNHLVATPDVGPPGAPGRKAKEYLVVWAGDANVADINVNQTLARTPLEVGSVPKLLSQVKDALPGPDFLAVIDADKDSNTYGKVVNTVALGPLPENEPHHMQYLHTKGDKIFTGGLYSDTTYVLDTKQLPLLTLSGVNLPTDTLCGSVPDAYWVLEDGTAYAPTWVLRTCPGRAYTRTDRCVRVTASPVPPVRSFGSTSSARPSLRCPPRCPVRNPWPTACRFRPSGCPVARTRTASRSART